MNTLYEHGVRKLADKVRNDDFTKESIVKAILPVFMLLPCFLRGGGQIQQFNIFCESYLDSMHYPRVKTRVSHISVNFEAGKVLQIFLWTPKQCIPITQCILITIRMHMQRRFIVGCFTNVMIGKDPALLYLKKFFKNIWR